MQSQGKQKSTLLGPCPFSLAGLRPWNPTKAFAANARTPASFNQASLTRGFVPPRRAVFYDLFHLDG